MASKPLIQSSNGSAAAGNVTLNDAEKGAKTDSYLVAMSGRRDTDPKQQAASPADGAKAMEPVVYAKNNDQVQFVQPSQAPSTNIGLTKEELEQYRNDPFWKKLRIFLFVLFWLLWIAMFVAAILIVIFSPKCAPKYEPKWWQNQVCYQAWVPSFQDSTENADGLGDLPGMNERLNKLRKLGLSSVWPTPLLSSLSGNGVDITDYMKVEPKYGTNDDFKMLTESIHSLDMRTIMDLPLTTTSVTHGWFLSSAKKEEGFADAYVWSSAAANGEYFKKDETNGRGDYYLHMKGKENTAIPNWRDPATFDRLTAVMKFYLDEPYKVDGFHLTNIEYAARTADGSSPDWDKIVGHVKKLRNFIEEYRNNTENADRDIVLFTSVAERNAAQASLVGADTFNYLVDTSLRTAIDVCTGDDGVFDCLYNAVSANLPHFDEGTTATHLWQLGNPSMKRLASQLASRNQSELALVLQLMLPGASTVYYGDALGMQDIPDEHPMLETWERQLGAMQWSAEANAGFSTHSEPKAPVNPDYTSINFEKQYGEASSPIKVFRKLSSLRLRDETLMMGHFALGDNNGDKLLTFGRYQTTNATVKDGADIYVGALNFGSDQVEVKFSKEVLPTTQTAGEVVTGTSTVNIDEYKPRQKIDIAEKPLVLLGGRGIIIKFQADTPES